MKNCDRKDICNRIKRCSGCPNQLGKIDKLTFISIVNKTQQFFEQINKIEQAFGDIILDCLSEYPCTIINVLERDMGIDFDDTICDMIFNQSFLDPKTNECKKVTAEDVWNYLIDYRTLGGN